MYTTAGGRLGNGHIHVEGRESTGRMWSSNTGLLPLRHSPAGTFAQVPICSVIDTRAVTTANYPQIHQL